jgi:diguanylate cyclase (GGDEF)-like protein
MERFEADNFWLLDKEFRVVLAYEVSNNVLTIPEVTQVNWIAVNNGFFNVASAGVKKTALSLHTDYWIVMGIEGKNLFNANLSELTGLDVSLIVSTQNGIKNTILNSTLSYEEKRHLQNASFQSMNMMGTLDTPAGEFVFKTHQIGHWQNHQIGIVLCLSKNKAFLDYYSLIGNLAALLFFGGLLSLFAAALMSRKISRPIANLVDSAEKIREGQYDLVLPEKSFQEVKQLSLAFKEMISGIQTREARIHDLAFNDNLTGLPNRNCFHRELRERVSSDPNHTVFIMMLDVERFKEINDTLGHAMGDSLLVQIAERMKKHFLFYARISGDEFGVVGECTNDKFVEAFTDAVLALFNEPFQIGELVINVEVSIGVAAYPRDTKDINSLTQYADIALYACKDHHKKSIRYHSSLNKHSVLRLNLMTELRSALGRGELQLYFQPKLTLFTQRIDTVECLIRWIHPIHGLIYPDEFIPLAEQTGTIRYLTEWVLNAALHQVKQWQINGYDISIAVNISAMDLTDLTLPDLVGKLLRKYELDTRVLSLEVTESAIMEDPTNALQALQALRAMGITLSIDDFGTGYSSMTQLKGMPVHEMKIDKAFVLELASSADDRIMVKALVDLAKNLGLQTVAEGVEDLASLAYLSQIGCTRVQGYYLSKALPIKDFNPWLDHFEPVGVKPVS